MDIQTRKLHFIQDFLRLANDNILDKFEKMLAQEREKKYSDEIKPMTMQQYEQRIDKAFDEFKNAKVKTAKELKKMEFIPVP